MQGFSLLIIFVTFSLGTCFCYGESLRGEGLRSETSSVANTRTESSISEKKDPTHEEKVKSKHPVDEGKVWFFFNEKVSRGNNDLPENAMAKGSYETAEVDFSVIAREKGGKLELWLRVEPTFSTSERKAPMAATSYGAEEVSKYRKIYYSLEEQIAEQEAKIKKQKEEKAAYEQNIAAIKEQNERSLSDVQNRKVTSKKALEDAIRDYRVKEMIFKEVIALEKRKNQTKLEEVEAIKAKIQRIFDFLKDHPKAVSDLKAIAKKEGKASEEFLILSRKTENEEKIKKVETERKEKQQFIKMIQADLDAGKNNKDQNRKWLNKHLETAQDELKTLVRTEKELKDNHKDWLSNAQNSAETNLKSLVLEARKLSDAIDYPPSFITTSAGKAASYQYGSAQSAFDLNTAEEKRLMAKLAEVPKPFVEKDFPRVPERTYNLPSELRFNPFRFRDPKVSSDLNYGRIDPKGHKIEAEVSLGEFSIPKGTERMGGNVALKRNGGPVLHWVQWYLDYQDGELKTARVYPIKQEGNLEMWKGGKSKIIYPDGTKTGPAEGTVIEAPFPAKPKAMDLP